MSFSFTIPGQPRSKGRPRTFTWKGRIITKTPDDTKKYEKVVRLSAQAAGCQRIVGGVMLRAHFYLENLRRVDVDNLIKAIKDALKGVAWNDDSQVVEMIVTKHLDRERPRVEVWIDSVESVFCARSA